MHIAPEIAQFGVDAIMTNELLEYIHWRQWGQQSISEFSPHLLQTIDIETKELLMHIQERLFTLGAILATDPEKEKLKNGKERLS